MFVNSSSRLGETAHSLGETAHRLQECGCAREEVMHWADPWCDLSGFNPPRIPPVPDADVKASVSPVIRDRRSPGEAENSDWNPASLDRMGTVQRPPYANVTQDKCCFRGMKLAQETLMGTAT